MKFSIWYNEKPWFEDILTDYKDNISSVYFALPKEIWNSWRVVRQYEWDYNKKVDNLIKYCSSLWIETILLFNWVVTSSEDFSKETLKILLTYIEHCIKNWLTSITISNMLYLKILKAKFPNIKYYSSVNARVKNLEHALYLKMLWVDVITIDRDINRNIELIKQIQKRTWLEIQLMLNEPCLKNCPFRSTHFEMVAFNSEKIFWMEFEDFTCYPMIKNNKKMIFRIPFIRPEDLIHFDWIVKHYKLVNRDASNKKIRFMLDSYISWKYEWNIMDLFDLEKTQYISQLNIDNKKLNDLDFFNKIKNCIWDCDSCNICDIFLD